MDPLSIGGIALGAASLTFQLFSGCVQGYELLATARRMPADLQYLRIRLKGEQHRLLDWGNIASISESEQSFNRSVKLNRHLVNDVLHEMEGLLFQACKIERRRSTGNLLDEPPSYTESQASLDERNIQDLETRFPSGNDHIRSKALKFFRSTRKLPDQLHWAVFEKVKFEGLLANLATLNGFMERLMDNASQEMLHRVQQETFMKILQLNSKVDDLLELMNASSRKMDDALISTQTKIAIETAVASDGDVEKTQKQDQQLVQLARFKILHTAIEDGGLNEELAKQLNIQQQSFSTAIDPELNPDSFTNVEPVPHQLRAESRSIATYQPADGNSSNVWIEWKYYTKDIIEGPPSNLKSLVTNLAALLHDTDKPPEFRAPDCLGYFDDPESDDPRFGFVFQYPTHKSPTAKLHTLYQLFSSRKPSLSIRTKLASIVTSSIKYMHTTNWLYKGMSSRNILFFDDIDFLDYLNPYLCGYEYSRPIAATEMTAPPPQVAEQDIYRHPDVQGNISMTGRRRQGFKKHHDIYSLGIVLLEIALWKPIDVILELGDLRKAKPREVRSVRERLIDEDGVLRDLKAEAGDIYWEVCRGCLVGEFDDVEGERIVEAKGEKIGTFHMVVKKATWEEDVAPDVKDSKEFPAEKEREQVVDVQAKFWNSLQALKNVVV